jgi:hypothetical protein
MKTFKLTKETFIEYTINHEDLSYVLVEDLDTLEKNINPMKTLIDYFNTEYKWDEMFNITDVYNRINNNHSVFIFYYKEQPIGYMWFKKLDDNSCFTYNLYITNLIERPKESSNWLYNNSNKIIFKKFKEIRMEIFEWNVAAIKLVYSSGAKCITLL